MRRVVRVGTLKEFREEIPDGLVRLAALSVDRVDKYIIFRNLIVQLQGVNNDGEIVWLTESHEITVCGGCPDTPLYRSIADSMVELYELVKAHLEAAGYTVRCGSYGIPQDIKPTRGDFECVTWKTKDDSHQFYVVPNEGNDND